MYYLEVYEPGNPREKKLLPLAFFEADQPFLSINVGDYMNQSFWIEDGAPWTERLQITEIEHIITKSNAGVRHQMMVFTKAERETSH